LDINILKTLAKEYFDLFSEKKSREVAEFLSEEVTLNDWDVSCSGKTEVINAMQSIFNSVDTIIVKPIQIYCEQNTVIAELNIIVNKTDILSVVDIY